MKNWLKEFSRRTDGVAAIEFAFIAPVMIIMFLGTIEVGAYVGVARKVASLASSAADLTAQDTAIDDGEMTDIMAAVSAIVRPYDSSVAEIRISSIVADADGTTSVAWSDALHTAPHAPGTPLTVPGQLVPPMQGVIMAEVSYKYVPDYAHALTGELTITDTFYLKPRRSTSVQRL